jgi:hypothetical protein
MNKRHDHKGGRIRARIRYWFVHDAGCVECKRFAGATKQEVRDYVTESTEGHCGIRVPRSIRRLAK